MAAPHITGLTAVLSQYLDENPIAARNAELAENYSKRAIMQSILMSTAEPMLDPQEGTYYPVMQQGAGLVNVNNAINAKSVIMMGQKDFTLGAVTGSAADGKVKAELGDDLFANEDGSREFSFTIYNIYNQDQEYELDAALFVQWVLGGDGLGNYLMDEATIDLDWDVEFDYDGAGQGPHDVNMDGKTDRKDAQAITEYITGEIGADDINAAVADMDEDGAITSYDAYLLLNYADEHPNKLIVPAGGSKDVTVTITPDAGDVAYLYQLFPNGFYLEGYVYVVSVIDTADGGIISDMHTIPVYGFIGNWTDPSMFDENTLIDFLYGYYKAILDEDDNIAFLNYSGRLSNYIKLTYNGVASEFYGNPYALEDDIPYERFAVNSRSVIKGIYYNVLRSGATTGYAVLDLNSGSPKVIEAYVDEGYVNGLWFNENTGKWEETDTRMYRVDKSPRQLGLEEGDKFRIGYYSMPEYYGILYNMLINMYTGDESPINGAYDGLVDTDSAFQALLEAQFFGKGAYVGYDFTIDDTAPVIDKTSIVFNADDNTLTFSATDNLNIAYVSIMTIDGETEFWTYVPADDEYEETVDISDAVAEVEGYVALFVADYAGNETAVAVQVNDNVTVDPEAVASVVVSPERMDIYKNGKAQIVVTVSPITADQTIVWKSDDESIATVDEFGEVTGTGAGITTITAYSAADDTKFATCRVHVLAPSTKLNALLMDEDSQTYFVEFGASDVQDWARKHENPLEVNILNALNTSSGLVASTVSSQSSILYSVDPETFETTEIGENALPAFDMAPFVFYGYDDWLFVYPYAYVLVVGDLENGGGYSMEYFDEYIGEAWIAGIAPKSLADGEAEYFMIDDLGKLWTVTFRITEDYEFIFGEPELIADTGIEASFLYQNLYFDGTYLYWAYYNGNTSHLVVFDSTDGYKMYEAGDFGKNIWPATGFYMDGQIGAGISAQSASEPLEQMSLEPTAEYEALVANEELRAEVAAAIEKAQRELKAAQPADQTNGGVDTVKKAEVRKTSAADFIASDVKPIEYRTRKGGKIELSTDESGAAIYDFAPGEYFDIVIYEEDITTNGKYIVTYDPAKLTFNEQYSKVYGTPATVGSIHDDGNGTVTIAFADNYGVESYNVIAYVSFDTAEEEGLSAVVTTKERNEDLDLDENHFVGEIPELDLKYSATVTMDENFNLNLYVRELPEEYAAAYTVEWTFDGKSYEKNLGGMEKQTGGQYPGSYKITLATVFSYQMTLPFHIEVYEEGTEDPVKVIDYSVQQYFENMYGKTEDELFKQIYAAALDYGASAQLYFNGKSYAGGTYDCDVENLANKNTNPTNTITATKPSNKAAKSGSITGMADKMTATLIFGSETSIKLYFEYDGDLSGLTITCNNDKIVTSPIVDTDGRYSVKVEGIRSYELYKDYTITFTAGGETRTVTYSAYAYAANKWDSADADLARLVKALVAYGDLAMQKWQ